MRVQFIVITLFFILYPNIIHNAKQQLQNYMKCFTAAEASGDQQLGSPHHLLCSTTGSAPFSELIQLPYVMYDYRSIKAMDTAVDSKCKMFTK